MSTTPPVAPCDCWRCGGPLKWYDTSKIVGDALGRSWVGFECQWCDAYMCLCMVASDDDLPDYGFGPTPQYNPFKDK